MTQLTDEQLKELTQSIEYHCLSDRSFLYYVCRTYASHFDLEAYQSWFSEEDDEEAKV